MTADRKAENGLRLFLEELGPSKSVETFLRNYGNVRTRCAYAGELCMYFRWLRGKGIAMTPDELIQDNLRSVFESRPTDVVTKRKHTDLLGDYINAYLIVQRGDSEAKRSLAAAAIRGFYSSNDSQLFGYWRQARQKPETPPAPLTAEDIRRVLLAMPARMRTPLVLEWQSGIEINRAIEMDYGFVQGKEPPVKVELTGRKRHRRGYSTFIGQDSVEHLSLLGQKGMPTYSAMLDNLHSAVRKLGQSGLLRTPDLKSWHPHALRHSFETEASHAGVKAEIRDYFLGHTTGIQWTYNHRDEIHPEDLVVEYRKIEPYVSLNPDKTQAREEYADRERGLKEELENRLARVENEMVEYLRQKAPSGSP